VAPEVKNGTHRIYDGKADMYSLGVILFEMIYHPIKSSMERQDIIGGIRKEPLVWPRDLDQNAKKDFVDIVKSLLVHDPANRPSSTRLLRDNRIPAAMAKEAIQAALASMTDTTSPYFKDMMEAIFSIPQHIAKDAAYDMNGVRGDETSRDLAHATMRDAVKANLIGIFKQYGALESPRQSVFPFCKHYEAQPSVVQWVDKSGTLLQLPYDMLVPFARQLAKHPTFIEKSYAIGKVFRNRGNQQPVEFYSASYDVVTRNPRPELARSDAHAIRVLDSIMRHFPSTSSQQMCFHLNHSDILHAIFDYCGIEKSCRERATDLLGNLNVRKHGGADKHNLSEITKEFKDLGISAVALDDLAKFQHRGMA
jgi:translation initiation factor 2-alpha kinase 4